MAGSADDLLALVGNRIRVARDRKGLSQAALSEAVGVQPDSIGRMERGKRWPTLQTLSLIADALGIPLGDLLDRDRPDPDPRETQLLVSFRQLTERQRGLVAEVVAELAKVGAGGDIGRGDPA
jgi:transcriptional regulator with XRE-family HTH domain